MDKSLTVVDKNSIMSFETSKEKNKIIFKYNENNKNRISYEQNIMFNIFRNMFTPDEK